jgi:hypothetical protein
MKLMNKEGLPLKFEGIGDVPGVLEDAQKHVPTIWIFNTTI